MSTSIGYIAGVALPLLVTREMVAQHMHISIDSVRRLERAGKLRRRHIGEKAVRYPVEDLLALTGHKMPELKVGE